MKRKAISLDFRALSAEYDSVRVLVVEDEPAVRHLLDAILTRRGHYVLCAPSAIDAIALLLDFPAPPDLALIDVVLPGMSGLAYAEELRNQFPMIRLIFMTGWLDRLDIEHAERMGELLLKPFTPQTLSDLGI